MDEIDQIIWLEGLKNAVKFNGKANPKAIMGKLMRDRPELRQKGNELKPRVAQIISKVNSLSITEQKQKVLKLDAHALDKKEKTGPEKKVLPELPGAIQKKVVMRLAPYPSGALHIGNARMVVLNDEYVKKYDKMNEPTAKYVIPEAYDLIPEGLDWLGVKYHETHYKSDRVQIYQEEAKHMIDEGHAYVCTCEAKLFREKYKRPGIECPCRNKERESHQELYDRMLEGKIGEGEAVVRLKTGMDQKDPALRDHIMMRISDAPHPRIGTKVRLWPVLEWSWGLDDHLLGITHIIRGIDLKKEGEVEKIIWDLYGWPESQITLYGRMKFDDEFKLSKTLARQNVHSGIYDGWDDPRTWSLQSLKARGIQPQALRESLLDLGLSKRGIVFDKEWIYSKNSTIVDPTSNRYWFVEKPHSVKITDIPMEKFVANPLINPQYPKKGVRNVPLAIKEGISKVFIAENDLNEVKGKKGNIIYPALKIGQTIRFKDLFNVKIEKLGKNPIVHYESQEKEQNIRKIQVVPQNNKIRVKVLQPDGNITSGYGELNLRGLKPGTIVQFERYGYVKLKKLTKSEIYGYFTN